MHKLFSAFLLILTLSACSMPKDPSPTPPGNIQGAVSDWVVAQITQQAQQAQYTPTMIPQPTLTPGPSIGDMAATAAWMEFQAGATRQAVDYAAQATRQAIDYAAQNADATQTVQAQRRIEAQNAAASQTAEYWKSVAWSATQTAAAMQTAEAQPATQTAYSWTQTAIPMYATANAGDISAQSTIVAGQAQQVDMAVRQQRWSGAGNTIVLWAVISAAMLVIIYYVWKALKSRKLTPDGKVWSIEDGKGNKHVVSSDLMGAPDLKIGEHNSTPAGMVSVAFQEKVTERAQKVRAIEAAPAQNPRQAFNLVNGLMTVQMPRFSLEAPKDDGLTEDERKALDKDWSS